MFGSGMRKWSDPDTGSRIKHPGSATLGTGKMVTTKIFANTGTVTKSYLIIL
jgi:hypothetical protein